MASVDDLGAPSAPVFWFTYCKINCFLRRIVFSSCLSAEPPPASTNGSRQGQTPVFSPSFTDVFRLQSLCFSLIFGKTCKDPVRKEWRSEVIQKWKALSNSSHPPNPAQGTSSHPSRAVLLVQGEEVGLCHIPHVCLHRAVIATWATELLACYTQPKCGCYCPLLGFKL